MKGESSLLVVWAVNYVKLSDINNKRICCREHSPIKVNQSGTSLLQKQSSLFKDAERQFANQGANN